VGIENQKSIANKVKSIESDPIDSEAKQLGAVGKKVNMIRENISPEPVYSLEKLESLLSQLLENLLSKKLEQS